MQSTLFGQWNIPRPGVEDADQRVIKVGDTVRHTNGAESVVISTHTADVRGYRYDEIDVEDRSGPWDPKEVRKI